MLFQMISYLFLNKYRSEISANIANTKTIVIINDGNNRRKKLSGKLQIYCPGKAARNVFLFSLKRCANAKVGENLLRR